MKGLRLLWKKRMEVKSAHSSQQKTCDALEVSDRTLQLPDVPSVHSVSSLAELRPLVESFCEGTWDKTLFAFDIDQTLLKPSADEAQSKAVAQHWAAFKASTPPLSVIQHDLLFSAAVATDEVALMEPEAPLFLEELKEKGASVIALTAGLVGPILDLERFEVFCCEKSRKAGFHFTQILDEEGWELPFPEYRGYRPRYYKGMVFTNGVHVDYTKGDVLQAFLDELKNRGCCPEQVVFVDDARRNILTVHERLGKMKHLCCEYTRYKENDRTVTEEAFLRYWKGLLKRIQA